MNPQIIAQRNQYSVNANVATLVITKRIGDTFSVMFDAADLDVIQRHCWRANVGSDGSQYAITGTGSRCRTIHDLLVSHDDSQIVTYLDGDTSNVRRSNLLAVTRSEHQYQLNPTDGAGYASWHRLDGCWNVYGYDEGRKIYLGRWPSRDEAVEARHRWQGE